MKKRTVRIAVCLAVATSYLAVVSNALAQRGVEAQAWDGQTLSQQATQTQAMFTATWGDKAGVQWATEHSRALVVAAAATRGLRIDALPPGLVVIPDGPPIAADTTVLPLHTTSTNAPPIGDLIDIDEGRHRLYVGNRAADAIEVYDVSTANPVWLKAFHVPGGVAGILVAPDLQKVMGGSPHGLVIVDADPNSPTYGTTLNTIDVGPGGTDELDYDPVDHKVYVTDVADRTVASVDAIHNSLIKTFTDLPDDQIEQPRYDPADGMIYASFGATNQIARFDPRQDRLLGVTPIGVPCTPYGFAIKPATNMALLGCGLGSQALVYWNLKTNTLDHTIANVSGADQVIYNARADRFFAAASGWHRGPVMAMLDGSGNFITNVPTTFASHEVGYDQTNRVVYTIGGGLISFSLSD